MTDDTYVTLAVEDGSEMRAYVAQPSVTPRAGIIVIQEAFGVNPYIRSVADRFASEGYLAVAPELFHRTAPGFESDYVNRDGVAENMAGLTLGGQEHDLRAAYEWLRTEGGVGERIATVGFCMGGKASYLANAILPLKAAVSYYGGGIAPDLLDRAVNLNAPMLFFWGGKDAHIPRELWSQIPEAMEQAGKSHITVEMGDAGHGFFCDQRDSYDPAASALAWPLTLQFLDQKLSS
ncbi:MAG: dienelactone hydrolase family protein [Bacillota bacterium]